MSVNLREIAPAFAEWFEAAARNPAFSVISEAVWLFSLVQVSHLLFMAILGGAVLALNLRLLGVILPDLSPQQVERATRPWFRAGAIGTIVTGAIMATSIALTILASAAFLVKIIALVASILLSAVVAAEVRSGCDAKRPWPLIVAVVAIALWVLALFLFATTRNLGGGAFLVALAGFALATAFTRDYRTFYVGGAAAILSLAALGSLLLPASEEGDVLAKWTVFGGVALALLFALVLATRKGEGLVGQRQQGARFFAFASTLAWITTAMAGRWIGFS